MGSTQSKPAEQEQLVEKLRALDLKSRQYETAPAAHSKLEKGYVIIEGMREKASTSDSHQDPLTRDVSIATTEAWEKELLADAKNRLALSAFSSNPITAILASRAAKIATPQRFNISIPDEGRPVTNQRSSGRCWLFAATNVFRIALIKKHNLKEFELSQAYLFFYDKLEKANYFLENVLETLDEPLDGRLLQDLLSSPVGDGGQWDMVANLVEKYGLVPQTLYPDSFNAMKSSAMGTLITTKLREDALRLRELAGGSTSGASLVAAKTAMVREIHLVLTLMLGPPPSPSQDFTWEYYDKDAKYHKLVTSPVKFSKELSSAAAVKACSGTDVHRLFSLVNDPRHDYGSLLTVDRLGNVWGGRPITYVNVKMSTMKDACIAQLKAGLPVFFGSDVGKYYSRDDGLLNLDLYDYTLAFNLKLGMSKAERLRTGESAMTHAMVLTAVQIEDGKSVRWRIENSWSDAAGDKGYFAMTDEWMDQFVYQAVVDPKFVSKEVTDVLKQEPKVLPHWDPMGALA